MLADTPVPFSSPPLFDVFWEEHRQKVIGIIALVALFVFTVGGVLIFQRSRRIAAEALFSESSNLTEWQNVITRYPRSGAAANALLLVAAAERQAHEIDRSSATYSQFLEKFPRSPLAISALLGRAFNDDAAGHPEQALDELQQAAVAYPKSYGAPFALWMRAGILARLGKTEEVTRTLQMISSQYPTSVVATLFLRQRMGQLPR